MRSKVLSIIAAFLLLTFVNVFGQDKKPLKYIIDMVHHNPGEPLYESKFTRPDVLKDMGYNSKCFYLFDSPTLAINWDKFDKRILPEGSPEREWVDKKAARLHVMYNECKRKGMKIYAMSDLILLPKRLIELYHIDKTFGDPQDTLTQRILRFQMDQIFRQFPEMDGLIVRIGETYLEDAPYHKGSILNKGDADKCIIPLMNLLRDEVCVKLNKKIFFRTWWTFDTDAKKYEYVSKMVEPHPNLVIAVKHCEGDFHRGNPFSKVLGLGRHPQLVEIQCAREYEGKGCYPNYIAKGVIDGFEEHQERKDKGELWNLRDINKTGKLAGLWTWTRGGGWEGPYPTNELWCDLNAWILAQWANNPQATEQSLFNRFCKERLHLDAQSIPAFRQIALLSAHAALRGFRSVAYPNDVMSMWTRDEYISFPELPKDVNRAKVIISEKDDAVNDWNEIVKYSQKVKASSAIDEEYIKVSCEYGRQMFRIFRAVFHLAGIKQLNMDYNKQQYLQEYDDAWNSLKKLESAYPSSCPSLYSKRIVRRTNPNVADDVINTMR
jgi:hypothetical protein